MGKWVTKCSIETLKLAPCTPDYCYLKKNLPPGLYTHRYGGGRQAVGPPPGRLGPFLGREKGRWASSNLAGRCTDQYGWGSWATPGLDVTARGPPWGPTSYYVYPRSTKSRVYGNKSVTRGAHHPHKMQSIPSLTSHNKIGSKNNIIILQ